MPLREILSSALTRALNRLNVPRQDIGPDANNIGDPLMYRYHLCFVDRLPAFPFVRIERCRDANDRKRGKLVLHQFLRGDNRQKGIHSHPWRFWSIVLLGWYREKVCHRIAVRDDYQMVALQERMRGWLTMSVHEATYEHMVTDVSPGTCWTLAIHGPVSNAWGFPFVGETVRDASSEKVR